MKLAELVVTPASPVQARKISGGVATAPANNGVSGVRNSTAFGCKQPLENSARRPTAISNSQLKHCVSFTGRFSE
jgi:hypothetical protein